MEWIKSENDVEMVLWEECKAKGEKTRCHLNIEPVWLSSNLVDQMLTDKLIKDMHV